MLFNEFKHVWFICWDLQDNKFVLSSKCDFIFFWNTDRINSEIYFGLNVVFVFVLWQDFSLFNGKTINWTLTATNDEHTFIWGEGKGRRIDRQCTVGNCYCLGCIWFETVINIKLLWSIIGQHNQNLLIRSVPQILDVSYQFELPFLRVISDLNLGKQPNYEKTYE